MEKPFWVPIPFKWYQNKSWCGTIRETETPQKCLLLSIWRGQNVHQLVVPAGHINKNYNSLFYLLEKWNTTEQKILNTIIFFYFNPIWKDQNSWKLWRQILWRQKIYENNKAILKVLTDIVPSFGKISPVLKQSCLRAWPVPPKNCFIVLGLM